MRVRGPNNVGSAVQLDPTLLRSLRFGDHGTKEMLGVAGLEVWPVSNFAHQLPTTSNNMQQGKQTDTTCNINNDGSCWPTMMRLFARGFSQDREKWFTVIWIQSCFD